MLRRLETPRDPPACGPSGTSRYPLHPHVHCVVTGGGLSLDGTEWLSARPDFLFPVRVLGVLFRSLRGCGANTGDGPSAPASWRGCCSRAAIQGMVAIPQGARGSPSACGRRPCPPSSSSTGSRPTTSVRRRWTPPSTRTTVWTPR
ncbi:MAG: transposase [Polyangiaceae bacterium]|nr:transposase [Polyangiaceae bacterium]